MRCFAIALLAGAFAASSAVAAPTVVDPGPSRTQPHEPQRPQAAQAARVAARSDPLSALGAGSPSCRGNVNAKARRNCAISGSVAHGAPISFYGFDVQIGFSLTDMDDSFLGALQSVAGLIWMALVFLVKGVLLLVEWGFSIDLLGEAMPDARRTLATLHERVIGEPWFLAALSAAGLWGIWRGLVQRRTGEAIGGLGATVLLMAAGLVMLANPDGTVGYASKLANDASLGILSAATTGNVERPTASLSQAMSGAFDVTVRDPWCALQFGSVDWCHERAPGGRALSNGDVWLAYPAGSGERKALYKLLKGEEPEDGGLFDFATKPLLGLIGLGGGPEATVPDEVRALVRKQPERAAMQEAGSTFSRLALLALIVVGMTGAIALLAYLGIRLLLAAILALILLLLAPAMLLAPAFGESGRATFLAWVKRLVGALIAKLVYALFLAVVLAASATLTRLDIGWFGVWLLQIAFWWGILIKRQELVGFVSAGAPVSQGSEGGPSLLGRGYYAMQIGRVAMANARSVAAKPLAAAGAVGSRRSERATARTAAVGHLSGERVDAAGRAALSERHGRAATVAAQRPVLERELRAVDRKLAGWDEAEVAAAAQGREPPNPTEEQNALLAHRRSLQERLASPELRAAEQAALAAARERGRTGESVSARDLEAWRAKRERELQELPLDHVENLRSVGIDPSRYAEATGPERAGLRKQLEERLAAERALLRAASGDDPAAAREARIHFDPREVRVRTAEERARQRRERSARRARANLFRPR